MELKLETPDGIEVPIERAELSDSVKANLDSFNRTQANPDAAEDDKRRPPKRAQRDQLQADDATQARTEPAKRGRPRKEDAARTTAKTPDTKAKEPLKPHDFRGDLNAAGDGVWLGLSQIPVTAPYAAIIHANQEGIVEVINAGAQVNHGVRNFVEKLTTGTGNAWVLQGAVVGMNIGMQCYAVYKDADLRSQVVEANKVQVQNYVDAITGAQSQVA